MTTNESNGPEKKAEPHPRPTTEDGLADVIAEKISVPSEVWRGIEAVRRSGLTNMLDRPAVAQIAGEFGFYETAHWVESNRKKYSEGIFKGFEVADDGA